MTPEIEKLKAIWQDARKATQDAKQVEEMAVKSLDAAVATWAVADLDARGIAMGVTPVDGCRWLPRDGREPRYDRDHVAVVKVTSHGGEPRYLTQRLTKMGALSKAVGSRGDAYILVRKAGEA